MKFAMTIMATAIALTASCAVDAKIQPISHTNDTLTAVASAREPQGLRIAAEAGLRSVISELTRDLKAGSLPAEFPFDVNDLSELKLAKLGLSFEVNTIQPQTLLAGNRPMEQMVTGTGIWNFVVMVNVAVVIESIFAWPGIGELVYVGITQRDFPLVQGVLLMGGVMVVLVNLVLDVTYAWLDPRIRLNR